MSGRGAAAYLAMLAVAVAAYLAIRTAGQHLVAPPPPAGQVLFGGPGAVHVDLLPSVLVALVAITVVAQVLGRVFLRLGQPPVLGEIVAGIALGPSLLGRLSPALSDFLFPAAITSSLHLLAQLGVILFMFLVGIELDPGELRRHGRATLVISHASIVLPFVLGALLGLGLYPRLATSDVPFTAFSLFMGVSMSVTAFPVLARILGDRGMQRSPLGVLALTCAAIDDVTAWCLLAFVVSVVRARALGALVTTGLVLGYILLVIAVLRPLVALLARRVERRGALTQGALALTLLVLLSSALATDAIGVHAVFGAFAAGVCIRHDSLLGKELLRRLDDLVVVLFLPAFFVYTGLRMQLALLDGGWLICGGIIAVASFGKLAGSAVAARLSGLSWRDATSLGVLMNTRGLMELIVLNVGLELHVLSPTLFAMLVLMALVTTFMTTPALQLLSR